jgi:branched-subunit amino acid transport protein
MRMLLAQHRKDTVLKAVVVETMEIMVEEIVAMVVAVMRAMEEVMRVDLLEEVVEEVHRHASILFLQRNLFFELDQDMHLPSLVHHPHLLKYDFVYQEFLPMVFLLQ